MYIHIFIHTLTHTHTHTHTYIYTQTHTHAHTRTRTIKVLYARNDEEKNSPNTSILVPRRLGIWDNSLPIYAKK